MAGIDGITEDNTILFITGHSLGASTANVLGLLAQERGLVRESANFVYTYASPKYNTGSVETGGDEHMNFRTFSNKDDIVPVVPPNYAKTGVERIFDYSELEPEQKSRFDRVYGYFRNVSYEKDRDLNSHMLHTYLSFYLSELPDREIDLHLSNMEESDLAVETKTELLVGEKAAFTVTASCPVTVSTEDPAVISVSDGVLTALKSGKTVITVTAGGNFVHEDRRGEDRGHGQAEESHDGKGQDCIGPCREENGSEKVEGSDGAKCEGHRHIQKEIGTWKDPGEQTDRESHGRKRTEERDV